MWVPSLIDARQNLSTLKRLDMNVHLRGIALGINFLKGQHGYLGDGVAIFRNEGC